MSKFIEVSNRYKKYFINVDNISSIHSTDKDKYNTKVVFNNPIIVFSSKDGATYEKSLLTIESYDEIKALITQ